MLQEICDFQRHLGLLCHFPASILLRARVHPLVDKDRYLVLGDYVHLRLQLDAGLAGRHDATTRTNIQRLHRAMRLA